MVTLLYRHTQARPLKWTKDTPPTQILDNPRKPSLEMRSPYSARVVQAYRSRGAGTLLGHPSRGWPREYKGTPGARRMCESSILVRCFATCPVLHADPVPCLKPIWPLVLMPILSPFQVPSSYPSRLSLTTPLSSAGAPIMSWPMAIVCTTCGKVPGRFEASPFPLPPPQPFLHVLMRQRCGEAAPTARTTTCSRSSSCCLLPRATRGGW